MKREVELAKKLLESKGYNVSRVNESALDQFKKLLHSANDLTLDSIKKIAMDLDIDSDELPTEEEAQKILDIYNGKDQAENHVSPARNSDSSREEKLAYARELLKKAKNVSGNTNADDATNAAWELVDFLHDTMLLEK